MRTRNFPQNGSRQAERLASFRQQMADFARGEELRKLRDDRHLSQEDAAHEIGVSVKSLRAWEKGGGIRWTNAKALGDFYEVDPKALVSREDTGEPVGPLDELSRYEPSDLARLEEKIDALGEQLETVLANQARLGDVVDGLAARERKSQRRSSRQQRPKAQ